MNYEEKTISTKQIYKGNVINVEFMKVCLPNGKEATRDIVRHPGASVVIPISDDGSLYMVRQFRKPIDQESLEIPAGKLDEGECPEECAKRELKEETGLESDNIKHIVSIHSTPGFSDEILHMYVAKGLKEGNSCADEDEFISTEKIEVNKLMDMVLRHEITDAKTIIGILFADKIIKGEISGF
ncbi:MAG: NUDIX hydrolase [Clostridia bacterium]|nr:NUDIX hydrolase [Clostridia bacterium]